ncbi:hypothetical protein RBB50_010658 [Rhinocladiella similis]
MAALKTDYQAPATKVVSPSRLAHVVLCTNKSPAMVDVYKAFLGAEAVFENEFLAFITYDDEHHRIALVSFPGTQDKNPLSCGLEHIAFTFDTLPDLLSSYRQRKQKGIEPVWPVNHGPTTSIYYRDPDGNMLETQVDNFDSPDAATDFMKSKEFSENPIGVDFDPEDYIRRLSYGEHDSDLKKRAEIGPRAVPSFA